MEIGGKGIGRQTYRALGAPLGAHVLRGLGPSDGCGHIAHGMHVYHKCKAGTATAPRTEKE
jgi:hypothetical protein